MLSRSETQAHWITKRAVSTALPVRKLFPVDGLEGGVHEGGAGRGDEAEHGKDPAHLLLAHALARHRPEESNAGWNAAIFKFEAASFSLSR